MIGFHSLIIVNLNTCLLKNFPTSCKIVQSFPNCLHFLCNNPFGFINNQVMGKNFSKLIVWLIILSKVRKLGGILEQ